MQPINPPQLCVYIIKAHGDYHKVGYSQNVELRLGKMRSDNPEPLTIVHLIKTDDAALTERYIHVLLGQYHHRSEWFLIPPNAEELKEILKIESLERSFLEQQDWAGEAPGLSAHS